MIYTKLYTYLIHHDVRRYQLRDVLDPDAYHCIGFARPISYDDVWKICRFLKCKPEDIFNEDDLNLIYERGRTAPLTVNNAESV